MAQGRRTAQAAAATKSEESSQPAPHDEPQGEPVMEMAAGRESREEKVDMLEKATHTLIEEVRGFRGEVSNLRGVVETYKHDEDEVHEQLLEQLTAMSGDVKGLRSRVADIESRPLGEKPPAARVRERAEITGNFITRNAKKLWREVKPGPVNRDHVKGALVTNVAEYLAFVTMAQVAPIATMNIVSTALLI